MIDYREIKETCKNQTLVVVSKKRSINQILEYYNLGERCFGENRVDELLTKVHIKDDIQWHFIGHLQRNKVKMILPYISCIQSVESIELVKTIQKEAKKIDKIIPILIQFNYANESTKSGLHKDDAINFIKECLTFSNIQVKGTMCMGPHTNDTQQITQVFEEAHNHFLYLQSIFGEDVIQECSMGMSSDYKIAIEHGSTCVRIGSILFEE